MALKCCAGEVAPSGRLPGSWTPRALGPLSRGGREFRDLPQTLSPEHQLQALLISTSREFESGKPPNQRQMCNPTCRFSLGLWGGPLGRPPAIPHWPLRPGTHSIRRLPSSRPLPSTISTQFLTGSSSGLEKSIWTFTGFCTRACSSTCGERGDRVGESPPGWAGDMGMGRHRAGGSWETAIIPTLRTGPAGSEGEAAHCVAESTLASPPGSRSSWGGQPCFPGEPSSMWAAQRAGDYFILNLVTVLSLRLLLMGPVSPLLAWKCPPQEA